MVQPFCFSATKNVRARFVQRPIRELSGTPRTGAPAQSISVITRVASEKLPS